MHQGLVRDGSRVEFLGLAEPLSDGRLKLVEQAPRRDPKRFGELLDHRR